MAPRKYSMGKRAAQVAETRRRILDAAVVLYQEQGFSSTSMQDVARRADVAPGTVLNHFATPEALMEAVATHLTATLQAPTEAILEGVDNLAERVRRVARELAAFYERSEPWYRVYEREQGRVKVLTDAAARFFERIDRLVRLALGPLGRDEAAATVTMTLVNPGVFGQLRSRGMTTTEAADVIADVLLAWLERETQQGEVL